MKRVAILGGGIAGLSAAFYLERARRAGAALEWTLFEKSGRLGGVIRTEQSDGFVLEAGPDSFLTTKPDAARLCHDLGIGGELISSNDAQRKTWILVRGKLTPMPEGLEFMVPTRLAPMATSPLFSLPTKARMAVEWFSRPRNVDADESVADFVRRHFGQQMVDRVAEPLLAGVYGGEVRHLSLRAVLPRFAEMERQAGSLVRATLHARKARANSSAPQPLFTSLRKGMQQMVDAIVSALPPTSVRLNQRDLSLQQTSTGWKVNSQSGAFACEALILAVPSPAAATLLNDLQPELAGLLSRTRYTSSAAVLLAFDRAHLPPGFGFLVPATENRGLLACTFVHRKFPHRAPDGKALLRCFFTSARLPGLMDLPEAELQSSARAELQEILGLTAEPLFAHVFRWSHGLPQYEVGHLARVAEAQKMIGALPGLHLAGNLFYGVGVPDCIRSARLAIERITASASQPAASPA